jgi:hypothetical protein
VLVTLSDVDDTCSLPSRLLSRTLKLRPSCAALSSTMASVSGRQVLKLGIGVRLGIHKDSSISDSLFDQLLGSSAR